jgi:peptidoglycan/xylan/chitin deacetylase (PgdA/CDA1 family)
MNVSPKDAAYFLYKYSGVMHAQECLSYWSGRRFTAILLFHRVTDEIPEDGLTVSTDWFRRFCEMMRDSFHVISMAEFHRLLKEGKTPPPRTVAITFDDCYRDNLFAARVLADHRLPATFFVPTRYIGTDYVFEWDKSLKRMPNLGWDDVKELLQMGHEIGSHTVSHADLGQVGPEAARSELGDSRKALEDRLQRPIRWFAYPFGGRNNFRPEYLPLVYEVGYDACFSGFGGFVSPRTAGSVLPRESMPEFRSLVKLELHLSGCLDWFYRLKRTAGMVSY